MKHTAKTIKDLPVYEENYLSDEIDDNYADVLAEIEADLEAEYQNDGFWIKNLTIPWKYEIIHHTFKTTNF